MTQVTVRNHKEKPKNTRYISVKDRIFCNGFCEISSHPGVYLAISADNDYVECPYCDCRFIYDNKKAVAEG